MNAGTRIAAFAAAVAVVSGGAAVAGGAIDPKGQDPQAAAAHGHEAAAPHGGHGTETKMTTAQADDVRGLAVASSGQRLIVDTPDLRRGRDERLAYRIVDARGQTVRDFDVTHTKRVHLIVVRRDLTGFQHLHPEQRPDGSWTTTARLDDAGSYRLFADGAGSDLRFTVTRGGQTIHVEPYLGAGGHLVALREGDLAFLHVHPMEGNRHDDSIRFGAEFPTAGRYRLFLQFKHNGQVHTAAFTKEVR
ncbi:MAG: hypothetical protein QOJ12_3379 [Thermoleophilales bacterium]|nr:hypothetical protein [Thermoleophilales bacterium]